MACLALLLVGAACGSNADDPSPKQAAATPVERRIELRAESSCALLVPMLGLVVSPSLDVQALEPGGAAELAGVHPGDQLLEINRTPVRTHPEARRALVQAAAQRTPCPESYPPDLSIDLTARRGAAELVFAVDLSADPRVSRRQSQLKGTPTAVPHSGLVL